MMLPVWGRPSLLWKMLLATTIPITIVVAFTGWLVQSQTVGALTGGLQKEVQSSFEACEAVWNSRAETLGAVSMALSTMSDVRAAFQTNDGATIRDTAAEIWSKISESDATFLVTDPRGLVIASLGGSRIQDESLGVVRVAAPRFPRQAAGFSVQSGTIYELVITPVYVQTAAGPGLLDVLVAGFPMGRSILADLKKRTGSDFIFVARDAAVVSTMPQAAAAAISRTYRRRPGLQHLVSDAGDFAVLASTLRDLQEQPIGDLLIVRSYDPVRHSMRELGARLLWIWTMAIVIASAATYILARRILRPIHQLDQAAARLSAQDFSALVPETGRDELGRLARTFNQMSRSIREARDELIRHERIATIGRLATSIVHDLRNPLASIYGGAEMMVDGELSERQMVRVAGNIYRSSRVIKDLLQELSDVSRGRVQALEPCQLREVIAAAIHAQEAVAEEQKVTLTMQVDSSIELLLERARIERVFVNLISNALEVMPHGGKIDIVADLDDDSVIVRIADTGPGLPPEIRATLFQPFVTGKKNGLGLGLALSRQAVVAHGGAVWAEDAPGGGACFCIRLALHSGSAVGARAPAQ